MSYRVVMDRLCPSLTLLALALLAGCGEPSKHDAPKALPESLAIAPAQLIRPLPTPTPAVPPTEKTQFVFTFPPGPDAQLYVYDKPKEDVFAYPGAGKGVSFAFFIGDERFLYQQGGAIRAYDHPREMRLTLVDPLVTGLLAFNPTTDKDNLLYFLATADPASAALGIGEAFVVRPSPLATGSEAFPWGPLSKLVFLSKINAVSARHGGISSIAVNGAGDAVFFTTTDGGLYLYTPQAPSVLELRTNRDFANGRASSVSTDAPWGRWVVWEDFVLHRIFVLDRWTGLVDPLPYPNSVLNATTVRFPFFSGYDPYHIFFTVFLPDGSSRQFSYDLRNEGISTLTLLNFFP